MSLVATTETAMAQSETCIAPTSAALAGPFGYAKRSGRCEGLLRRYFGRGDDIELVGYTSGSYDMSEPALRMSVLSAAAKRDAVTIRALSLTSLVRYQMDATIEQGRDFQWPLDLVLRAQADRQLQFDPSTLAIVGCTNRCARQSETLYFPVAVQTAGRKTAKPLLMKVRADANATDVRAAVSLVGGGERINLVPKPSALSPDALTTFALPDDIGPGEYRFEVKARAGEKWMSSLLARILVP